MMVLRIVSSKREVLLVKSLYIIKRNSLLFEYLLKKNFLDEFKPIFLIQQLWIELLIKVW